jgi:putative endonuclease
LAGSGKRRASSWAAHVRNRSRSVPRGQSPGAGAEGRTAVSRDRRAAYRRGHWAERLAGAFLLCKGYRPLARRYRTPLGEIDLVVRRGRTIVFVEVKARASLADGFDAIGGTTERRILAAADMWLARHPHAAGFDLRFDLVLIVPWRLPHHVPNAIQARW